MLFQCILITDGNIAPYADAILSNYAIIQRNANEFDLLLNDGIFVTQQNPRKSAHQFPNGFDHHDYVLAIAGN